MAILVPSRGARVAAHKAGDLRMDAMSSPDHDASRPAGSLLRWLVLPWTVLVLYPFLALTTVLWGFLSVVVSLVSQRAAFHCGEIWAACLAWVSFVRVDVTGREHARADQSYIMVCNHQGAFDILALYGFLRRQFRWVIKQELRKVPFLGWGCAAIGHIFVDRSNPKRALASLEAAKPRLVGGVSALFFPEGTRSLDHRPGPFKKGAFQMARQIDLPVLPITVSGSWRILPKATLLPRPGVISVRIHPPISPADHPAVESLMEATRDAIIAGLDED
jgi:1-acyl-sn-glycerol-3-phosphate acyltransferase